MNLKIESGIEVPLPHGRRSMYDDTILSMRDGDSVLFDAWYEANQFARRIRVYGSKAACHKVLGDSYRVWKLKPKDA